MTGEWQFDAGRTLRMVQEMARRRDDVKDRLEVAEKELAIAVKEARQAGVPWEMLTPLIGMTRHAMTKRIAQLDE